MILDPALTRAAAIVNNCYASNNRVWDVKTHEYALSLLKAAVDLEGAVERQDVTHEPFFTAGLDLILQGVVACLQVSEWVKPDDGKQNPTKGFGGAFFG